MTAVRAAAPPVEQGAGESRPGRGGVAVGIRATLARLFPAAPGRPVTVRGALLAGAAVLAGAVVSLLRQPGAGALDTVWAEDGKVFLADAVNRSTVDAFGSPYAGYFHLVPRAVAEMVSLLPASFAAEALAISAALGTAGLALLVYVASGGHFTTVLPRLLVSAGMVLVPVGQDEVLNSIANLQWPGLYAMFWLLLWTPAGRAGRVVAVVVTVLVVGSDIIVLALLPLVALRLWVRRDRYSTLLAGLICAGLAVQALALVDGGSRRLYLHATYWLDAYVLRVVPAGLLGQRWPGDGGRLPGANLLPDKATVAWLLILAAVLVAVVRRVDARWPLAAAAACCGTALYALPTFLSSSATPRYAYPPAVLLLTTLVALLGPDTAPTVRAVPRLALVALVVVVYLANFRTANVRGDGPRWDASLREARERCAAGAAQVEIQIPPRYATWLAVLPCHYVR